MPEFRERVFSIRAFCPLIIITCLTYQGICNPFLGGLLPPLGAACCTSFPRCSSLYSSSCLNHLLEHLNKPTYTPLPSLFFLNKENSAFCYKKTKPQSQRQFCPLGPQWRMFFYLWNFNWIWVGGLCQEAALYRCWNGGRADSFSS